jgi:hypothetical protein
VLSAACTARQIPAALTAGDLAFLKAIYYKNKGLGPTLSRAEIEGNTNRQFEHRWTLAILTFENLADPPT